jgi:hypothetical protein
MAFWAFCNNSFGRAMLLIRFAFALTLLGLAVSLSAAQSEQETAAAKEATLAATLIHQ